MSGLRERAVRFYTTVAALIGMLSGGCLRTDDPSVPPIRTAADLKGKRVAHMSSGFHKKELLALQPDIVFDPYCLTPHPWVRFFQTPECPKLAN